MKEMSFIEFMADHYGDDDVLLLDVRDASTFSRGTIPGAVNIPMARIGELYDLPMDRTIYVFCQSDEFSREVAEILTDAGYEAVDLTGGYRQFLRDLMNGHFDYLNL